MNLKLFIGLFFSTGILFSQQLTIEETINYINENLTYNHKLIVNRDGTFEIFQKKYNDEYLGKVGNRDISKKWTYSGEISKIKLDKSIDFRNDFILDFKCNNGNPCFLTVEKEVFDKNQYSFGLRFKKEGQRDKVYNAFKYLIGLINESPEYQTTDDDPFANENFKSTYSFITGIKSKEEIKLDKESGIYYILIEISGIKKQFVLDSGASEISLSAELEKEFITRGILTKDSYIEPALYRIADGSIVAKRRVLLKEVKVGEFTVNNVTASIGSSNIPLLLGKSFLDKFRKWTIDNESEKLILEK